MTARLVALLLLTAAAPAGAQTLAYSPAPYDGSGGEPLAIRNVGTDVARLDSLAFATRYRPGPYLVYDGGLSSPSSGPLAGLDCSYRYAPCNGRGAALNLALAPGDTVHMAMVASCGICRPGGPAYPDTLWVWHGGLAVPDSVAILGLPFGVGTEPGPARPPLAVSVSPVPARGAATVRVALRDPSPVQIDVLDVRGRVVWRLDAGSVSVGERSFRVPLGGLAAGVYAVRATAEGRTATARLVVAR